MKTQHSGPQFSSHQGCVFRSTRRYFERTEALFSYRRSGRKDLSEWQNKHQVDVDMQHTFLYVLNLFICVSYRYQLTIPQQRRRS